MIAPPAWLALRTPDPSPLMRLPRKIREVVVAVREAGFGCDYAGTAYASEVYLVSQDGSAGRLVLDRSGDSIELWRVLDPNGMPTSWGSYERRTSGADVAVEVVRRGFDASSGPAAG